jgi:hypothetical protein
LVPEIEGLESIHSNVVSPNNFLALVFSGGYALMLQHKAKPSWFQDAKQTAAFSRLGNVQSASSSSTKYVSNLL